MKSHDPDYALLTANLSFAACHDPPTYQIY